MQLAKNRKKLIETALPLKFINEAGAREKSIRHGHPSTLHLWWSRKPLAVARAVIFAQMVDDPSEYVDVLLSDPVKKRVARMEMKRRQINESSASDHSVTEQQMLGEIIAEQERERLFDLIKQLVKWENTNNARLLEEARAEIWKSWRRTCVANADHPRASELFDRDKLPAFHDPFAGGGALPLEAQRLGLEAHASDLNPVAVLINKAMIEIPPLFAGQSPVNPDSQSEKPIVPRTWKGAQGLAEDVQYYGEWMREEAKKQIGHLYPKIEITADMAKDRPDLEPYVGESLTVIAWLWARTVKSPNPAFREVDVPLAYTFMLSTRKGKEAYVEPIIDGKTYRFVAKVGVPVDLERIKRGTKLSRGANFECIMSGVPINGDYIKKEGQAQRMGSRMMAIVAEGNRGRVYLAPDNQHEYVTEETEPNWKPENQLIGKCRDQLPLYGMNTFADLFTSRQLVALTTFSDLVGEAIERIHSDAIAFGLPNDNTPLRENGIGATAYAQAVGLYLAFMVDKCADFWSTVCSWATNRDTIRGAFGRQAIPMVWSYAEANPFSTSTGNCLSMLKWIWKCIKEFPASPVGVAEQADAFDQNHSVDKLVSTDPPYYDNICYADISDYHYVWMRASLKSIFPELLRTLVTPKSAELVATTYRYDNKQIAEKFFLDGMTEAIGCLGQQSHIGYPVTVYYAYKQSETRGPSEIASTGWETFLEALISAGFAITGTWPMRTELSTRMLGIGTNALASSVVLVCRFQSSVAPTITLRKMLRNLRTELPKAVRLLQEGNIVPVDLAQAAIGPGMEVYTRYAKLTPLVQDASCTPTYTRGGIHECTYTWTSSSTSLKWQCNTILSSMRSLQENLLENSEILVQQKECPKIFQPERHSLIVKFA